jgi:hypothetical protein
MVIRKTFVRTGLISLCLCAVLLVFAQDEVCLNRNELIELGGNNVKNLINTNHYEPVSIDSTIHNHGRKEAKAGLRNKKKGKENNPQLNSWALDAFGFFYSTVAQSYERRLKNKRIGIRIPLYIGYYGGSIPDGAAFPFVHGSLSSNPRTSYAVVSNGFSVASGINPKFYVFKYKVVSGYAGPEANAGYSETVLDKNHVETVNRNCILSGLGKFGLSFNPNDQFTFGLDAGLGLGGAFGGQQSLGLVGVWHLGFFIGTNF